MTNAATLKRISQIPTIRLAGRAARLLRTWGAPNAAKAAEDRRRELQVALRGGRAKYNHQ